MFFRWIEYDALKTIKKNKASLTSATANLKLSSAISNYATLIHLLEAINFESFLTNK